VNIVRPLAVDRTRVSFLSYVWDPALVDKGASADLDRVERQDGAAVESVQQGMRSRLYRRGRYAPRHAKRRPPAPTAAPIVWQSLGEATRAARLDDHAIKLRLDKQQDRCGNDSSAHRCTEMTAGLTRVIADDVRKGGKLPPTRLRPG
jgi:hypothetical protein